MQKRTIYSLLLTSFILVFAFSASMAQTVTFESKSMPRCQDGALDILVNPGTDISGFEVVFQVSTTSGGAWFTAFDVDFHPGLSVLTNRYLDLSGVDNVSPDTVRIAGMVTDAGDACLAAGSTPVATVFYTTNDVCTGTVTLSPATVSCIPVPGYTVTAQTQLVACATSSPLSVAVTDGVVTIVNQAPTVATIPDATLHWGQTYLGQIVAADPDLTNGCESLAYSKVSGPAALTVNATTGAITWLTTGADVCTHEVEVMVTDGCGATVTTAFEICVQNTAPTLACDTDTLVHIWGDVIAGAATGSDMDHGPLSLLYSLVSVTPSVPVNPVINPATGAWTWATEEDNAFLGDFQIKFAVTDGANLCDPCSPQNADTCTVNVHIMSTLRLYVQKTHGSLQGEMETVSIYLDNTINPMMPIGGYDLLLQYDNSALTLMSAEAGQMLTDCRWEYFTYRFGANGNCGAGACPTGIVRLVAIAETNNGANHPSCFLKDEIGPLATVDVIVTADATLECQYAPMQFFWLDCGDNAFSSRSGDTLLVSRDVFSFEMNPLTDNSWGFPGYLGAPDACLVGGGPGKPAPVRCIDFTNGGVDIICADSIDARADINLNLIPYEIGDAVLFSSYFVQGLGVFTVNQAGQIAASDVNADGITLSVADLVYLIRVIVGDGDPTPKLAPSSLIAQAQLAIDNGVLRIERTDVPIGAMSLVLAGEVKPRLEDDAAHMELRYEFDGANTRVLISNINGRAFLEAGNVLWLGNGQQVKAVELGSYDGYIMKSNLAEVPTTWSLSQNYPNPFNPQTTISFTLKETSDWTLTVYNVLGQEVTHWSGQNDVGAMNIKWDAGRYSSGVYLYRLRAGDFSATRKMVLLK